MWLEGRNQGQRGGQEQGLGPWMAFTRGAMRPGLPSGCYIEMDRREAREELEH